MDTNYILCERGDRLALNGGKIRFVKHVTISRRTPLTEHTKAKFCRTFIKVCFLFKGERLSTEIKLTLHNALIDSTMTYVCPAW